MYCWSPIVLLKSVRLAGIILDLERGVGNRDTDTHFKLDKVL